MGENSDSGGNKGSFWTTLPGILTGVAAVLTASGTLAGVFVTRGGGEEAGPPPPPTTRSEETTRTEPTGPTLEEWALRANAICRNHAAQSTQQSIALSNAATPQQALAASNQIAQLGLAMVDEIRREEAPPAEERRIERMLDSWEDVFRGIHEAMGAFVAQDAETFTRVYARVANLAAEANADARRLGAGACADVLGEFERFDLGG